VPISSTATAESCSSIALVSEDGSGAVVVAMNLRDGSVPRMPALADDLLCPALQPPA
jgi:hypothetical protein